MGALLTKIKNFFSDPIPKRILMVGLDAAGKTTILNKLKLGEVIMTYPTIGFNVESITYKSLTMTVWDVGGQDKIRPLWRHYYHNLDGLIYVVDSADEDRVELSAEELHKMLADDLLRNVPLLVYANKQDHEKAMKCVDICRKLKLTSFGGASNSNIAGRQWYCQGSSAISGDGLYEGLDWLAESIKKNNAK